MMISDEALIGKLAPKLSVVVPVYNQEEKVESSLERITRVLHAFQPDHEVVVVNDGSTDNTLDVLKWIHAGNRRLRVVTYSQNMGKGYAVKTGVTRSRGDIVLFTDGDLDISPHMMEEYVRELSQSDLVIASKRHPLSRIDAARSRKLLSKSFNLIVRVLTGIPIKDTQSGLKAGSGPALRTIFRLMLVKRYAFDVELLTIASLLKMQIKEMPVEMSLHSRFKTKDIARMFVDVIAVAYRHRIARYYQRQLQKEAAILACK